MARIRPDQIESWTTENPVLEKGELGYELETSKAKLGDGVTAWNDLEYWSPSGPAEDTSVAPTPSTTRWAVLTGNVAQVTTAGDAFDPLDLTNLVYTTPDDYWGSVGVGVALPLVLEGSSPNGHWNYPDADRFWDVTVDLTIAADVADNGKLIGVTLSGNDLGVRSWVPIIAGEAVAKLFITDRSFLGDDGARMGVQINAALLSANCTSGDLTIEIVERF